MSHLLENHQGMCKNLHGHNFKLFVTIVSKDGLTNGMVMDFSDIKNIVNQIIISKLDHAFVYNKNDKNSRMICSFLKNLLKQKVFAVNFRVTSENLVKWIVEELNRLFVLGDYDLRCAKGVLYETDTSYATYYARKKK